MRREIPRWEPTVLHGVLHKDPLALRGSDPLIQIVFVPTVLHFCKHSIQDILIGQIIGQIGQFKRVICEVKQHLGVCSAMNQLHVAFDHDHCRRIQTLAVEFDEHFIAITPAFRQSEQTAPIIGRCVTVELAIAGNVCESRQ